MAMSSLQKYILTLLCYQVFFRSSYHDTVTVPIDASYIKTVCSQLQTKTNDGKDVADGGSDHRGPNEYLK